MIANSQEAGLKSRRLALMGKIKRRNETSWRLKSEAMTMEDELRRVERQLEQYREEPTR